MSIHAGTNGRSRDLTHYLSDLDVFVVVDTDPKDVVDSNARIFYDADDMAAEVDHLSFSKGRQVTSTTVGIQLKYLFPKQELYTLFDGKTHTCEGLYRTKEDAEAANMKVNGKDWRAYAVLKIEFTC